MPTTESNTRTAEPLEESVFDWRFEQLRRAGYGEDAARELARRGDVDLHRALELVERGCLPDLAFEILR